MKIANVTVSRVSYWPGCVDVTATVDGVRAVFTVDTANPSEMLDSTGVDTDRHPDVHEVFTAVLTKAGLL